MTIRYNNANSKTKKLNKYLTDKRRKVYSFDLPAGRTCPSAHLCKARAVLDATTGKRTVKDGPATVFRCFAASDEARFKGTFNVRKENFETLLNAWKTSDSPQPMADLLHDALPLDAGIVRIHVSGDFFSSDYFYAWVEVARRNPDVVFYAYTKELQYLLPTNANVYYGTQGKPSNLRITASRGGRHDAWIDEYDLPEARVVYSVAEAESLGLEIDNDDSHAMLQDGNTSFALLIHGTQPKGSDAGKAVYAIRKGNATIKAKVV
jgi:hypothetical protein